MNFDETVIRAMKKKRVTFNNWHTNKMKFSSFDAHDEKSRKKEKKGKHTYINRQL